MSNLRAAAQQALRALEGWQDDAPSQWTTADEAAITALRAALAQEEQEPVAWIDNSEHPKHRLYWQSATEKRLYGPLRPLYTAPPRREWKGLSENELGELMRDSCGYPMCPNGDDLAFAHAIEQALKERNHG